MATIQVRDIPDDVHERLTASARRAGQSLQAYMRSLVLDADATRQRKSEAIRRMEAHLDSDGGIDLSAAEVVAALHADRR